MAKESATCSTLQQQLVGLPDSPGVYLYFAVDEQLLYIGKAASLRKRVQSYFRGHSTLSPRIAQMVKRIIRLEIRETASEAEALLLEANLIKKHHPRYNVAFRDDKAYPYLKVTNESFPRLRVVRRRQKDGALYFGPYSDAGLMHNAVRFMRRVFPLRTCSTFPKSPCLEYHLGQCLAPCVNYIDVSGYQHIVKDLVAFLNGKRDALLKDLSRRMHQASRCKEYEEAARMRDQIQALTSVIVAKEKSQVAGPLEQLVAALKLPRLPRRIEAFDISNISGAFAVGSMVVFVDGKPYKRHYRHFNIKTVQGIDDFAMMAEVIRRRYKGTLAAQLPIPDLVLIDGGKGHLAAACEQLNELFLNIPATGLAKRFEHLFIPDSSKPIVLLPTSPVLHLVQHIRDEAHRFAITFHRKIRDKAMTVSVIDTVQGIGPVRKKKLIRHFGSIRNLTNATVDEIARAVSMPQSIAVRLHQTLTNSQTK